MPHGRPIDETEEEVQDAALLDDQDEAEARGWARRHLPRPFEQLAEGEEISDAEVRRRRRENDLTEL